MNWRRDVASQVEDLARPLKSKAELVEYYQAKYPEKANKRKNIKSWKQHIIEDLSLLTGIQEKSLEKRFDTQRRNKPEPKNTRQYEALGLLIGPILPKFGYHIEFNGWLLFSQCCEKRGFSEAITGKWAEEIAKEPLLIITAGVLLYMEEDDQTKPIADQAASIGICEKGDEACSGTVEDPKITIEANKSEKISGHRKLKKFSFF